MQREAVVLLILGLVAMVLLVIALSRVLLRSYNYAAPFPGSVVLTKQGDTIKSNQVTGLSNVFIESAMEGGDYQMRIGSVTQAMTAIIILQLVSEKRLLLTDSANMYIPQVPIGITIDMLGRMRSGLFDYINDKKFMRTYFKYNPYQSYTPSELLEVALSHPVLFPPGTGYNYSNTNYIVLGMVAEKVTGEPLQDLMKKRIFDTLGMNRSFLALSGMFPDTRHNEGYVISNSSMLLCTYYNPSWMWAAGAVVSTPTDMIKFAKPMALGTLIPEGAARDAWLRFARLVDGQQWSHVFHPHTDMIPFTSIGDFEYAFGMMKRFGYVGSSGSIPGYDAFVGYVSQNDTSLVVLCNLGMASNEGGSATLIAKQLRPQLSPE